MFGKARFPFTNTHVGGYEQENEVSVGSVLDVFFAKFSMVHFEDKVIVVKLYL